MSDILLGEYSRTIDERYRLSLPAELADELNGSCTLAKERPGCLSLWDTSRWHQRLTEGVDLVTSKIEAGRLESRLGQVQLLGRLLSTRHVTVKLAGRGRLVIPEGFREFLGVEPGGNVMIVGAAVCVELWNPENWHQYVAEHIPSFRQLVDELVG